MTPSYAFTSGSESLNASNTSSSHLPTKFSQPPNLHTFITSSLFYVLAVLALRLFIRRYFCSATVIIIVFGNNVERNIALLTKWKQIEYVEFVSTLSKEPFLLPGPFLLSYRFFAIIFPYFFVFAPCDRLSWPAFERKLIYHIVSYRISYRTCGIRQCCFDIVAGAGRDFRPDNTFCIILQVENILSYSTHTWLMATRRPNRCWVVKISASERESTFNVERSKGDATNSLTQSSGWHAAITLSGGGCGEGTSRCKQLKLHPHQQQCRSNIRLCCQNGNNVERVFRKISSFRRSRNKLNIFILFWLRRKDEISFDIVATPTPPIRFVVDLLYNKLYNNVHNKSTTNRSLAYDLFWTCCSIRANHGKELT